MDSLPRSVQAAIDEALRLGPRPDAPPLVQLAWIYGDGMRIVLRACDEHRKRRRGWRRWFARD